MKSYFLMSEELTPRLAKSDFSEDEKLLFVRVATGLQVTEDAPVATGLYVVQPLTVVTYTTVGARLHAF